MNSASIPKPTGCKPVPLSRRWLRRLLWGCVCLISLLTVYYQWENRRSALELKTERARLIERLGTDDPLAFSPPKVRDDENYFAIAAVEAWATEPLEPGSAFKQYHIPEDAFWPKNLPKPEVIENEAEGTTRVDWAKWAANRDLKGETAAVALNRELGDLGGLLPKLAAGLDRPFACLKPGLREAQEAAKGELWNTSIPQTGSINPHLRALDLNLRCAAAAGDKTKAQQLAMISLRLFPEAAASHGSLVSALVALAGHGIVFGGLQEALSQPVWDERSLTLLQAQLAKENDLHYTVRALGGEALWMHAQYIRGREQRRGWRSDDILSRLSSGDMYERLIQFAMVMGPIGWHDADSANHLHAMLLHIGPDAEDAWLDAGARGREAKKLCENVLFAIAGVPVPDPRRLIGGAAIPNLGNLHVAAAETLFRRRCLILACELEKHRLRHGSYPAVLPLLSGFETNDPARPKQPLGYRLEKDGYVITSAHEGWLWRMKRTP
jgi:hypothetical protein